MLTTTLRATWAHKRRLLGTVLAVAIGVAFLSGTLIFNATLDRSFEDLFTDAVGQTDVEVRSSSVLDGESDAVFDAVEGVEPGEAPHRVDRLESSRRYEPRPRIARHTLARPLFERRPEGVVQRFLGGVEISQQPDEGGQHAARLRHVHRVDGLDDLIDCRHSTRSQHAGSAQRKRPSFSSRTGAGRIDTVVPSRGTAGRRRLRWRHPLKHASAGPAAGMI